jgi:hypothetical protein
VMYMLVKSLRIKKSDFVNTKVEVLHMVRQ